MKFLDKIKIAFHHIVINPSRSIITIIIIFIVGTLILSIMMIAINFSNNLTGIQKAFLDGSIAEVDVSKSEEIDESYYQSRSLSSADIEVISDIALQNQAVSHRLIAYIWNASVVFDAAANEEKNNAGEVNGEYVAFRAVDYTFPLAVDQALLEGRIWSKSDCSTNNIWVTDAFLQQQLEDGLSITIGGSLWFHTTTERWLETGESQTHFYSQEFIIQGIVSSQALNNPKVIAAGDLYGVDVFFDLQFIYENWEDVNAGVQIQFFPPQTEYPFQEVYRATKKLVADLEKAFPVQDNIFYTVESNLIEGLRLMRAISSIIISIAGGLSFFILLLSIGSVSNTIMISVDKSKKFLGLLKALGLKNKGVADIVKMEAFMTIGLGIMAATLALWAALPLYRTIIEKLINGLFGYGLEEMEYVIQTIIPYYLPFVVILFFTLMALLFARGSLRSLSKMDVISIISEVS